MISCDIFRARFAPATDDPSLLEHLRSCDNCLRVAVETDPDILFRSIGGAELMPPGGLDPFVDDVMREVRLRSTETSMSSKPVSWTRRLAIAATVALAIAGGASVYQYDRTAAVVPRSVDRAALRPVATASVAAIESYDSINATIVEMPAEGEDVRVVMVFDDSLPADL